MASLFGVGRTLSPSPALPSAAPTAPSPRTRNPASAPKTFHQFNFFEKQFASIAAIPPGDPNVAARAQNSSVPWSSLNIVVTCSTSGNGYVFLGDSKGIVHIVNVSLQEILRFSANPAGALLHIRYLKQRNTLITAGEDENLVPVIRVWNLDKTDKITLGPVCVRTLAIQSGPRIVPLTAFSTPPTQSLSLLACALESGQVITYRGDLSRDRSTKTKVVFDAGEMVTGLVFVEPKDGAGLGAGAGGGGVQAGQKGGLLLIVTPTRVVVCDTGRGDAITVLDATLGCDNPLCITPTPDDRGLVIGNRDGVYMYSSEGRGVGCRIESDKHALSFFRSYLCIISLTPGAAPIRRSTSRITALPALSIPSISSSPMASSSAIAAAAGAAPSTAQQPSILTLYDIKNRFVPSSIALFSPQGLEDVSVAAGFDAVPSLASGRPFAGITSLSSEWGKVMLTLSTGAVLTMQERDLDAKLDACFRRNMYALAVALAQASTEGADGAGVEAGVGRTRGAERDYGTLVEIHKRHADHLYALGDFDGAMAQYVLTIPQLEPSYVVRRFLDAQRVGNLVGYLEKLHEAGVATADHTTLLLGCYAKGGEGGKLEAFVKGNVGGTVLGAAGDAGTPQEPNFDVPTAIKTLRSSPYPKLALLLAGKYGHHDTYLRILVDDLRGYKDATEYIATLSYADADRNLKRWAGQLVPGCVAETTQLLIRLCTGWEAAAVAEHRAKARENGKGRGDEGLRIKSPTSASGRKASTVGGDVPLVIPKRVAPAPSVVSVTSSRRSATSDKKNRGGDGGVGLGGSASSLAGVGEPPAPVLHWSEPEHFVHFFVAANAPAAQREALRSWCILFLERVVEARRKGNLNNSDGPTPSAVAVTVTASPRKGKVQMVGLDDMSDGLDSSDCSGGVGKVVWNTLLELYLESGNGISFQEITENLKAATTTQVELIPKRRPSTAKGKTPSPLEIRSPILPMMDEETRAKKIMDLLSDPKAAYDVDHALVLCKWHNFKAGSVFLNEKLGLYSSILQIHMDAEEHDETIAACDKYGDHDPTLWTTALIYFAQRDPACRSHLHQVLDAIETRDLLPPLQVLQSLAREAPSVSIGTVKEYLVKQVRKEKEEIDDADRLIEMYRAETDTMRKQIDEIRNSPIVFQATKCSLCGSTLDLPSVHFFCKHSYHHRCLGDAANDRECPKCAPEHRMIMDLIKEQEAKADQQEEFKRSLETAEDRFAVIAENFGKNMFFNPRAADIA